MHPERTAGEGAGRRIEVWLVAALTLALAACGSPSATTPTKLFRSYLDSTNVKHDEFTGSATRADRLSNFAAYFTPAELEGFLRPDQS